MIVCSKRAFCNILTQLWDKETLLNATYYIADKTDTGVLNTGLHYDNNGNPRKIEPYDIYARQAFTKFNIVYMCGELNPLPYHTTFLSNNGDPDEILSYIISEFRKEDNMLHIYESLFKRELNGNGIQVLLYHLDSNVREFGNMICQFLSTEFGADIIFLDAAFGNGKVYGQPQYKGNKEKGRELCTFLQDYKLISKYNINLETEAESCSNNLKIWLNGLTWDQLYYLYNRLWPYDPLAPGDYTESDIKQIIRDKGVAHYRETHNLNFETHGFNNMYSSNEVFNEDFMEDTSLFEQFEAELAKYLD